MRSQDLSAEEIVQTGVEIDEQRLRQLLEPWANGKQLVICIEDGDYEVGDDYLEIDARLRARHPDAVFYAARVGYAWSVEFLTPYDTPVPTQGRPR